MNMTESSAPVFLQGVSEKDNEVLLAEKIIQLDILRDQLYEELIMMAGNRTHELLRFMQNK
ncbi:hypothetical protein [Peribacillus sp. SCS-155]|uniref:hypothetical protein n=1 Tax=Peribacillus sedimenti TaxID=3115297 RepID=UPI003905B3B1